MITYNEIKTANELFIMTRDFLTEEDFIIKSFEEFKEKILCNEEYRKNFMTNKIENLLMSEKEDDEILFILEKILATMAKLYSEQEELFRNI